MKPRNRSLPRLGGMALTLAMLLAACGSPKATRATSTTSPGGTPTSTVTGTVTGTVTATASSPPGASPAAHPSSPSPSGAHAASPAPTRAATIAPRTTTAAPPAPAHTTPAPVVTTAAPPVAAGLPHFSHVVVIVMENEEYSSIIGNSSAPYINSLANQGALATQYYAISHPSLPNYLALSGGSTFGISSDCNPGPGGLATGPSLADQLHGAGISWKAYMEDRPPTCAQAQSDSGNYAVRHDPFMYYPNDVANLCGNVVPATQLSTDIASGQLPQFSWLTPNVCDDMHDPCGGDEIAHGDAYLKSVVPQILGALGPNGALFITFDEGTSNLGGGQAGAAGGQVTFIAAGPAVRGGYKSSVHYDHYSLLGTIEAAWGLPRLGGAAGATTMNDLFTG
jgi:hypothetical protein